MIMTLIIVPYLRISRVTFSVIQILYVVSTNITKFEILNKNTCKPIIAALSQNLTGDRGCEHKI